MPADDVAIALRGGACSLRQRAPLSVHDVEHVDLSAIVTLETDVHALRHVFTIKRLIEFGGAASGGARDLGIGEHDTDNATANASRMAARIRMIGIRSIA